jgi:hypothetical protein
MAKLGKRALVLPLGAFDYQSPITNDEAAAEDSSDPGSLKSLMPKDWYPQHHIHYAMRVMDVLDDLPKFDGAGNAPFKKSK